MPTSCADTAFSASRDRFEQVCSFLGDQEAGSLTHNELEQRLSVDVRELVRQLYQDHLDLRAAGEQRLEKVVDADGIRRGSVEADHVRPLQTIFGAVEVTRLAYRRRGERNLYPADAVLNLPCELHSHGLRELSAVEASRGSFAEASEAIRRVSGVRLGKRQLEQLAARAAADFEAFYSQPARSQATATEGDLLILSADGKGIVMRPDALRPATAKAAGQATAKLATRLSKGEKRNRKRMAEVGAVYDLTPLARTATDIIGRDDQTPRPAAPKATNKWLTASVVDNAATVITSIFDEAQRRDPTHQRTWVALVDGAKHQIDCIQAEARARQVNVTVICDFIHVLEYLSAPRGALLYPPSSGEGLEGASLGPMAYLDSKEKGDSSMPGNRRPSPGIWGGAPGDPRDMAKAGLPEVQSPGGAIRTPAGKMPETGAAPCGRVHRYLPQPPGRGAMPSQGIQGDEWAA